MTHEVHDETTAFGEHVHTSSTTDSTTGSTASSTVEPAAAAPPGRSRLAVTMVVIAGVLLIGAVVFGVLGLQAQSEASDQRDQAATATHRRHELADQEQSVHTERDALEDKVMSLPDKYYEIEDQFGALIDAHDHYVDVLNDAIDRHNGGDVGGATTVLSGDGASAITDLTAKKTATQQAVQTAQDALHEIQEGL